MKLNVCGFEASQSRILGIYKEAYRFVWDSFYIWNLHSLQYTVSLVRTKACECVCEWVSVRSL